MASGTSIVATTKAGTSSCSTEARAAASISPVGDVVRVRNISGWGALLAPKARWRERDAGYEMRVELPLVVGDAEYPVDIDVIVNETTSHRERRRGQLVLSGGQGEFVYLRGDRHDPARLIPLVLVS